MLYGEEMRLDDIVFLNCTDTKTMFYVYAVHDLEVDRFYIGSRKSSTDDSDLGVRYFTSSTNRDFVKRFKANPHAFAFKCGFYESRSEAVKEERRLHIQFLVNANPMFHNKILAGSCLTYNTFAVTDRYTGGRFILSTDQFDRELYKADMEGMVNCYDTRTGEFKRVSVDEFKTNDDLVGNTSGLATCIDLNTGLTVKVPTELYHKSDRYMGVTSGKVMAFDIQNERYTAVDATQIGDRYQIRKRNKSSVTCVDDGSVKVVEKAEAELLVKSGKYFYTINDPKTKRRKRNRITGEIIRCTNDEFSKNDDLVGVTKGMVKCKNKISGESLLVSQEEFDSNPELIGNTKGFCKAYDLIDHKTLMIEKHLLSGLWMAPICGSVDKTRICVYNGVVVRIKHLLQFLKENGFRRKDERSFKDLFSVNVVDFKFDGERLYAPQENI